MQMKGVRLQMIYEKRLARMHNQKWVWDSKCFVTLDAHGGAQGCHEVENYQVGDVVLPSKQWATPLNKPPRKAVCKRCGGGGKRSKNKLCNFYKLGKWPPCDSGRMTLKEKRREHRERGTMEIFKLGQRGR